jgi:hypothetical protein
MSIDEYERDMQFTVPVDGRATRILGKGAQHLYILNSTYYRQSLSKKIIELLYDSWTCASGALNAAS